MEFLKKRPVAILITLAVIVLATLFSAHRSLNNLCGRVEDGFYASVGAQLANCADAATGMASVTYNYPELEEQTTALRTAANALKDAGDISAKAAAYTQLRQTVADVNDALADVELTEKAQRNLSAYSSSFDTAVNGIAAADYNQTVREFDRTTLDVFPTKFLAAAVGIDGPQLFE